MSLCFHIYRRVHISDYEIQIFLFPSVIAHICFRYYMEDVSQNTSWVSIYKYTTKRYYFTSSFPFKNQGLYIFLYHTYNRKSCLNPPIPVTCLLTFIVFFTKRALILILLHIEHFQEFRKQLSQNLSYWYIASLFTSFVINFLIDKVWFRMSLKLISDIPSHLFFISSNNMYFSILTHTIFPYIFSHDIHPTPISWYHIIFLSSNEVLLCNKIP